MRHVEGDESCQPLIGTTDQEVEGHGNGQVQVYRPTVGQDVVIVPVRASSRSLWLLTASAGLSGLLFGYDTGVISSTLVSLDDSLSRPLTTWDKSVITSSTSLLALLFCPLAGYFADTLGRRPVIGVASLLFVIGAVLQALASRVWVMILGRSIIGTAVGLASAISPLYIAEIAPAARRGQLVTVQALFITGGQVVAYLLGWAVQGRWRWAVGAGALPAIAQALLLPGMPESPRWLVQKGRTDQARDVLAGLGQSPTETQAVLQSIEGEVREQSAYTDNKGLKRSFAELIRVPGNRRALVIACMLQGLQQLCGFNSLMYFSATIFSLVGFTSPVATSLTIALTNFVFTLLAFAIIDRVGRRRILLFSLPFMVVGLTACAIAFLHIIPEHGQGHDIELGLAGFSVSGAGAWSLILLASLIFYVAAYAVGIGCIPWQQGELFPLSVRSLGSGVATTTNWISNFITGASFLPMMQTFGPSTTFVCYAVVCILGWAAVLAIYPETAGLKLEDVGQLLAHGWGVKATKAKSQDDGLSERSDAGSICSSGAL